MRVRVSYTVTVDARLRRAIRRYHGEQGLATRAEVKSWYEMWGGTMDDDLRAEPAEGDEVLDNERILETT